MSRRLAYTSLLVHDYDQAIAFFTRALRFELLEDRRLSATKRWVVVSPSKAGAALLLAQPSDPEQAAMVGRQGAGRVWLFLHTDNIDQDIAHMNKHGVEFTETPRDEAYGRVVVFLDLYGNRWDLVQAKPPTRVTP
jgi:catechol 2,3-dioxygenase-like lactoylglutathione lyase family enzyme